MLSHVSDAIIIVHEYILELLKHIFHEKQVLDELWNNVLLEKLQESYRRAMDHARFLLRIEREGNPITYNHYFNDELQKAQSRRQEQVLESKCVGSEDLGPVVMLADLRNLSVDKSNPEHVREYLHDILRSYYKVSAKRFVDVVCQQVIDHHLLNGECSPLHVFSAELIFKLEASTLDMVAGEDQVTKQERERLRREIESLEAAMQVLRHG